MKMKIILSVMLILVSMTILTGCTDDKNRQKADDSQNVTLWEDVEDTW